MAPRVAVRHAGGMTVDVVVIHGAGADAHAEDAPMAASLERHLGDGFHIRYPPLPDGDNPTLESWGPVIARTIDEARDPVVLVAHSFGGYLALKQLALAPPSRRLASAHLIAVPFPSGDDEWTWDGFELPEGFADVMPDAVFLYASEDDEWVPFAHRDLYAAAIPQSVSRTVPGGHQLGDDLRVVADDIRAALAG